MHDFNELTSTLAPSHQTAVPASSPLNVFDLDNLISILKNDERWKKGEMNSMILLRNPSGSMVLVVLHERTEIKSKSNPDQINFRIIEGQLKVQSSNDKEYKLSSGETLTLNKSGFSAGSIGETAFLMTLKS